MTPERWAKITEVFQAAIDLDDDTRKNLLDSSCADDAELRAEVESLLCSHLDAEATHSGRWNAASAIGLPEPKIEEPAGRIGPYEVLGKIGSGGMAEVFRVRDERLGREVALKMLLPEFAGDAEYVERFSREARAASALEHPNICRLYDIGEWQGRPFLTMELLEGHTLRHRIESSRISVDEAVAIGNDVADAMAVAHARGFLHRDIKPANIFITNQNQVKVLDFGLAKRIRSGRANEDETTLTNPRTTPGTPSYMAPEQILGGSMDPRTDTFALGIVLFEMLTGGTPFSGDSAADVFRQVLSGTPRSLSDLRPDVHPELNRIVCRAIERDCEYRYQTAQDLRSELRRFIRAHNVAPTPHPAVIIQTGRLRRSWIAAALIGSLAMIALLVARPKWDPVPKPSKVMPIDSSPGYKEAPTFSPAGDRIAYSLIREGNENASLMIRQVELGTAVELNHSPGHENMPCWSPDGSYIAFKRERINAGYFMVPALGGGEMKVADLYQPPIQLGGRSLDWSPDGELLYIADRKAMNDPITIFSVSRSSRERKNVVVGADFLASPAASPDGKWLAYLKGASHLSHDIYVRNLNSGEEKRLTEDRLWIAGISWTQDSKSLIFSSPRGGLFTLWQVSLDGSPPQVVPGAGPDAYSPAVSKDGKKVVFARRRLSVNVWQDMLDGEDAPAKVISSSRASMQPDLSPNGKRIAFSSDRSGAWEIWVAQADGTNEGKITSIGSGQTGSPAWSPDGRWIAFDARPSGHSDIYVVSAEGGAARRVTKEESDDTKPVWSHDGRSLYFLSNRSGSHELWRVNAQGGDAMQVTNSGAEYGVENDDAESILYVNNGSIWKRSLRDGSQTELISGLIEPRIALHDGKLFFLTSQGVERFDLENNRREQLGHRRIAGMGAITADGKSIFYSRVDQNESEVLVLER